MWIYASTPPYAFMAQCLISLRAKTALPLPSFFLWFYGPIWALAASMKLSVSLHLQLAEFLGRVTSSAQGVYLYTKNTEKRAHSTNTKHPCPRRDSNPRLQRPSERREFMLPYKFLNTYFGEGVDRCVLYSSCQHFIVKLFLC
jgi:hypothetical protein